MEVRSGDQELTESMNVYASRGGVFVPLGEFSRVLDLAVGVFPAQRRAEGWVLSPSNRLVVDLDRQEARVEGKVIPFGDDQAAIYDNDLYVRSDFLEQLLPVKLRADPAAQVLFITATTALPFQQRAERAQRARLLGSDDPAEGSLRLHEPYALFSPPAFDVNAGGQLARDGVNNARRFDVRAAGDLLHAGLEAYVGSDDHGDINTVRVTLSRKDPDGHALGWLGGTRASLGDVFSPSMPIGAAGYTGRGVFYSSAPLESLDLATPLNLRGEMPLGEEVELYVNEVLQRAQTSAVQGRYEFLDVPLAFGLNTVRLVFYGPQGQTREVVRRINFGTGQLQPGQSVIRFGAIQQNVSLFEIGDPAPGLEAGSGRLVATLDYGVAPALTLSIGAARYDPQAADTRSLASFGLRGSMNAVAAQLDLAIDDDDGRGATVGAATRAFGVSLVGRHSEYAGGFIDETRQLGTNNRAPLVRATDVRADSQIAGPVGTAIPISLSARRLERADGGRLDSGELRASVPIRRYYASTSLIYEAEQRDDSLRRRWFGAVDLASLVSARLQTRAGLAFELSPTAELDSAYATVDWQVSDAAALRLGFVRSLGAGGVTSFQASHLWRAPRFDVAFNLAYETERQDWRMGLQVGFGFGYDPGQSGYRVTRPGVAAGGSVTVNAWVDENGDGLRQPEEPGVRNIVADTPAGGAATDAAGRLYVTGLGDPATANVRLNTEAVEDPFLVGGPTNIQIIPRQGHAARIDYPMSRSAEVQIRTLLDQGNGETRPLAALAVLLHPERGGAPIRGRSDHAGVIFFDAVPAGAYSVALDEDQVRNLGVALTEPVSIVVPVDGGFVDAGAFRVRIKGAET